MDLVAVSTIIDRATKAADQENSGFITPSEWLTYANYGLRRMHDFLISASGEEFFLKSYTFTLVSNTNSYTLPADFMRERGFDLNISPKPISMKRFQWRERNKYQWAQFTYGALGAAPMFCVVNNLVYFYPAPTVGTAGVTMWYFPTLQSTTDGGTTWGSGQITNPTVQVDGVNGYEQLAVLYAALQALVKEKADTTDIKAQIEDCKQWIIDSVTRRNDGDPMFVQEENADGSAAYFLGY